MTESLILTIVLLAIPIVLLFAFAGCLGIDPPWSSSDDEASPPPPPPPEEKTPMPPPFGSTPVTPPPPPKYHQIIEADPNLVSFWRLDEGFPETGDLKATDSAPAPNVNAVYENIAAVSRGQTGALKSDIVENHCVDFHGGSIKLAYDPLRNPPLAFSIEVWMRPAPSAVEPQVVFGSYELSAAGELERGFVMEVLQTPSLTVRARVGNETATPASIQASLGDGSVNDQWRHVVMTYNGASGTLTLYVNADDGKPDAQASGAIYKPVTTAGTLLQIAKGVSGSAFAGRLDEVALYRVALDGPTVQKHYLAGVTPAA